MNTGLTSRAHAKFCVLSNREVILYSREEQALLMAPADPNNAMFYVYVEGQLRAAQKALCPHIDVSQRMQPLLVGNVQHIAIPCTGCQEVKLCEYPTFKMVSTYKMAAPDAMCLGPQNTICVVQLMAGPKKVFGFEVDVNTTQFNNKFTIQTEMESIFAMCYVDFKYPNGTLVLVDWPSNTICAINVNTQNTVWKITGEIDGKICFPHAVVATPTGEVIVADGNNARLIVIDGLTGELINTQNLAQYTATLGLHLTADGSQLVVWARDQMSSEIIITYSIKSLLPS